MLFKVPKEFMEYSFQILIDKSYDDDKKTPVFLSNIILDI